MSSSHIILEQFIVILLVIWKNGLLERHDFVCTDNVNANRYNLMAHGMLLFLLLPPSSSNSELDASITSKTRQSIAGNLSHY